MKILLSVLVFGLATPGFAARLTKSCKVFLGPVNAALITHNGKQLSVYQGGNPMEMLLLTHHRRDVTTPTLGSLSTKLSIIAPAAEKDLFSKTGEYWEGHWKKRFHYYTQQSTKILVEPIEVDRWVNDGDEIAWQGLKIKVIATPGFTRGAVTYVTKVDGQRLAFTGDLIYGDGKVFDLYSFQDAIPEAKVGGYHGYGGRLADLVASLRKVKAAKPDVLVPARGPIIRNPAASIDKLIARVQALYKNYLSTNALHWYFKEDRMRICGERVLGKGTKIDLMPYCLHVEKPDWIIQFSTSRIIVADNGHGFLLDCGGQRQLDFVKNVVKKGLVKKIDGIFVTHTHDDHSQMVKAASEFFKCPVYSTVEYEDVLEHPGRYLMPGLTEHAVKDVKGMKDGATMKWHEYEFTFRFYPGQMFYHGGLLVKRPGEKPVFFIGDSFAPSGIDDYCLLNRNLVHPDAGYPRCFKILREMKTDYWLINQHIPFVFKFSDGELNFLEKQYAARTAILRELFPWDDPNYGIDERWSTFYPYGSTAKAGAVRELEVRVSNHSPVKRTFKIMPRGWNGLKVLSKPQSITLASRADGAVKVRVRVPKKSGTYVVTADVDSKDMHFRNWLEALVRVE
jgi:glyoxylase-like metal-dependent hydrolase (beta-lactamase superfamily II)